MSEDPRVESALSLLLFEIGERGQATFTDPRALISLILEGADEVAADTVQVDAGVFHDLRAFLLRIEWDWPDAEPHTLLSRLPNPGAGVVMAEPERARVDAAIRREAEGHDYAAEVAEIEAVPDAEWDRRLAAAEPANVVIAPDAVMMVWRGGRTVPYEGRDPARIPVLLEAIRRVWEQNPDQRLTQLIRNMAPTGCDMSPALYNLEDEALLALLPDPPA